MAGKKHYEAAEARQKLQGLLPHEWHKIAIYARLLSKRSRSPRNYKELLDEAVLRTLEGRRRWKIGLDGPSHMFGVMKSVLNSWNKSDKRAAAAVAKITALDDFSRDIQVGTADQHTAAALRQGLERLQNDKRLNSTEREVVTALLELDSHQAIMNVLGSDARGYRRILLSLAAYLTKDGRDSGGEQP